MRGARYMSASSHKKYSFYSTTRIKGVYEISPLILNITRSSAYADLVLEELLLFLKHGLQ